MQNVENDRGKSKTSAPWFKCFPKDYLEGTRKLSAEARGVYFDCLCIMYRDNTPLPFDDKWMSFQLLISPRKWRAIRDELLAAGKLEKTPDGYINKRAENEIENRTKISRTSSETSAKVGKNPEVSTRACARNQTQTQNTHTEPNPATVEPEADGGALACLNGSRFEMIESLAVWVSPYAPDRKTADSWLQTAVAIHSGPIVQRAFGELRAKLAQGDVIARPIPLLNKICERLKGDAAKASAPAAAGKMEYSPYAMALVDEARAAGYSA